MVNLTSDNYPLLTVRQARLPVNRRKVLSIDNFAISPGQHWCILGGNGSGKTTLAKLIRGELVRGRQYVSYQANFDPAADMDTVSFEEQQRLWTLDNRHDISEFNAEASDQGTTVARLICRSANPEMLGAPGVRAMLDELEISSLLDQGIRFLSSGQIRKVMIARALAGKQPGRSRLLILDDPLEAVDRQAQPVVRKTLQSWMDPRDATLLLCRRVKEVLPGITHLAILENMTLVEQGPIEQVQASEAYRKLADPQPPRVGEIPCQQSAVSDQVDRQPPIRLERVTAGYGDKPVLTDVSWLMDVNHHTLIEGPNGCGKSTLLSLIDGENHKAYGQDVYLFGVRRGSGESVWDIKSHFGVVSNEVHNRYVKGWRVVDVVVSGFYDSVGLYDDSGASQVDLALKWLASFSMEHLAREYFHEISFGQQRMVLLARAMVKQPDVLILDEPCVGLDDYFRGLVLAFVDRITECTLTQIIYVSHTEGEEPACINQRLRFEPLSRGGHRVVVD